MGKETISKRMNGILKVLFCSQFLNTTLMMMLVNSNFDNTTIPLIKMIFNGKFADFTDLWYIKLGGFYSQTLMILGLTPLIDLFVQICYLRFKMF